MLIHADRQAERWTDGLTISVGESAFIAM